jgi:GNAT superfamily N-acetyltransferase
VSAKVPRWSLLEVAAQRALLAHLAASPLARTAEPGAPVRWVVTGVASNTHNGVFGCRLADLDADRAIAATLRQTAGHPAIWHVGDGDSPADLQARLVRAGCRPERTGVVMGRLIDRAAAGPPDGRIAEITTGADLAGWRQVAGGVWRDWTGERLDRQAAVYASLRLGPSSPWRHWLARTDTGEPIGMASGLFTAETVMVDQVGVLESHRGAGIGAALVTTVVAAAAGLGMRYAVLAPTPESRPLYQRLGFTLQPVVPDRQFYLP